MQLETTFRGLSSAESESALRALQKGSARFERLIEEPCALRVVVEGNPEWRVLLTLPLRRGELSAQSAARELNAAISEACDKLKVQLVRHRHRRESQRYRNLVES